MILTNAWGLLALLGIPLLVALHIFRHRFREQAVSGIFLWGRPLVQGGSGRKQDRLRGPLSLLAECLALIALTWYLCDPHLASSRPARHHLVIIDGHQRLLARRGDGESVGARLLSELRTAWAALPSHDRISVIRSGLRPQLLVGPMASAEEASAAIDQPPEAIFNQALHDPAAAVELARELTGGQDGRLLLASDRPWPQLPPSVGLLSRGQAQTHSGLCDARWWRDSAGERLHLTLVNVGPAREREVFLLRDDGSVFARRVLQLPADENYNLTIPLQEPPSALAVVLAPDEADHLPIDDRVSLLRPSRQRIRVFLSADLPAPGAIERALHSVDTTEIVDSALAADLVISSKETKPAPGQWLLRIAAAAAPPQLGPFLARRGHPLMTAVDGRGVLWSGGAPLRAIGERDVLLAAGDTVLIDEQRRGRERVIRWHCQLTTSNLHRQPLWPVLFHNLLSERRAYLPGPARINLPASAPQRCCLPPGTGRALLFGDDGERQLQADTEGLLQLPPLRQPGLYRLVADGRTISQLQVHGLDARMSDLSLCRELLRRPPAAGESEGDRRRSPLDHLLPLLLAAIAALLAWLAWRHEERLPLVEPAA